MPLIPTCLKASWASSRRMRPRLLRGLLCPQNLARKHRSLRVDNVLKDSYVQNNGTDGGERHLTNGNPYWKHSTSCRNRWRSHPSKPFTADHISTVRHNDALKQCPLQLKNRNGHASPLTTKPHHWAVWTLSTDREGVCLPMYTRHRNVARHANATILVDDAHEYATFLEQINKPMATAVHRTTPKRLAFGDAVALGISETLEGAQTHANRIVKDQGSNGDAFAALSLLREMKSLGVSLTNENYNNVLVGCKTRMAARLARYIYLCMISDGLLPDVITYTHLIEVHAASGDLSSAFTLYRKMEREGIRADLTIFCALIEGLVSKGYTENAWRLYNYLRSWRLIKPDEKLLTVMIKACIPSEDAETAVSIYEEILRMKLTPTNLTYENMTGCLSRRRDYAHKCLQIYNTLKAGNSPISYHLLLNVSRACQLSGNTRMMKEILRDAHDLGFTIDEELIMTAILTCARSIQNVDIPLPHKVNAIRRTLHSVVSLFGVKPFKTPKVLNAIIILYEVSGCYEYALDTLCHFSALGITPDSGTYVVILRILGVHLCDPGRFFTLWDSVRNILAPDARMLRMALDMSMKANSSRRTIAIMEEMYTSKISPTPDQTALLYKKGKQDPKIHTMINKMLTLEKHLISNRAQKEQNALYSFLEEHRIQQTI